MKTINKLTVLTVLLIASAISSMAYADGNSGFRFISVLGCHKSDGTCFIDLAGDPITGTPSTCTQNSIRFDAQKEANGKSILALAAIAKATNRRIQFYINGCYANQPMYPTFGYAFIE